MPYKVYLSINKQMEAPVITKKCTGPCGLNLTLENYDNLKTGR